MPTDTARVKLELASGRNEITAPFYQTAQRRRNPQLESEPVSVDAPATAPTVVDVPLAAAPPPAQVSVPLAAPEVSHEQRGGRTPWIAFAIAIVSVGFAVWWVMAQRIPDIDPREVIARNLNDAHTAMADGRYSDPPERSAFHYYSTVLALDPNNHDAIAGIDAIADRHLTNARVLLAQHRIAEAGVALEKARRVRPDHNGLPVLDAQWRAQLKRMLAAATKTAKPNAEALEKAEPAIITGPVASRPATAPKSQTPAPEVKAEPAPSPKVADVTAVAATLAANQPPASLQTIGPPPPEAQPAPAEVEPIAVAEPPAPAGEPKLIRMVQPQYPQEALMRGIEGWVDVSLQISAAGDVVEPRVEDTSRGRIFNRAALAAVEQWKYEPRSDGSTSERVRVRLRFQRSN
ncbi:TonB family protein [Steroidobacter flavus]|uniref:Protein TonB n=1 Tax=Steroidobacter flavus TaxID=1842136 RepID=A0ABV8SQ89_9GAMM